MIAVILLLSLPYESPFVLPTPYCHVGIGKDGHYRVHLRVDAFDRYLYGVDSNAKIEWSHLFENDPKFNIYRLATNDKMHTLKLHVRTFRKDKGKEIEVHRDIYHFSVYHAKATLVRITKGKPDD